MVAEYAKSTKGEAINFGILHNYSPALTFATTLDYNCLAEKKDRVMIKAGGKYVLDPETSFQVRAGQMSTALPPPHQCPPGQKRSAALRCSRALKPRFGDVTWPRTLGGQATSEGKRPTRRHPAHDSRLTHV